MFRVDGSVHSNKAVGTKAIWLYAITSNGSKRGQRPICLNNIASYRHTVPLNKNKLLPSISWLTTVLEYNNKCNELPAPNAP